MAHILRRRRREIAIACGVIVVVFVIAFIHYYLRFSHLVDERLSGQVFHRASLVLSAPTPIVPGEAMTLPEVEDRLRKALYSRGEPKGSGVGTFREDGDRLLIYPGTDSFFASGPYQEGPAAITFASGKVATITDLARKSALSAYDLEPEVITTLFDRSRSKRLIINFNDCPRVLVDAVLSAEDRQFFSQHGVNVLRLVAATVTDIRADRRLEGGSTLTMQLARNFFLTPKKTLKRKADEIFLALLIGRRLKKDEIFALYANQVYMGQRGSFSIYGFGEAANAYFNKDVKDLSLPQAALLAGMIRGPNLYNPYRNPDRTTARRNWVLKMMAENHYITGAEARGAMAAPLGVTQQNVGGTEAPYFVDMVKDQLEADLPEQDLLTQSYRIYTTLVPELQQAAARAVHLGIKQVDKRVAARRRKGAPPPAADEPQAALVVLDPHTADVLALVGGLNYAHSQLNHALALRQPGSSFKPFVYAAALSSGVDGSQPLITPDTVLPDQASTTFQSGSSVYQPKNFEEQYYGNVTVREALALSLNVATVNLAQMVGYEKIKDLAIAAGINNGIQATPAIALGAYDATPLQIAGAYTIFSNGGVYKKPRIILAVKDARGDVVAQSPTVSRRVLDPRVSYLCVNLMETVIDHGTGEGARARGFYAPAAGKTGTSHDGWFSGFTSNLLATAWVGYDNDSDLNLTGASAALPIWTQFMKEATRLPGYTDVQQFSPPLGIITAPISRQTALLTANDPLAQPDEVFIDGTQPVSTAPASSIMTLVRKLVPFGQPKSPQAAPESGSARPPAQSATAQASQPSAVPPPEPAASVVPPQHRQSVVGKIMSIFHHHRRKPVTPDAPPDPQTHP